MSKSYLSTLSLIMSFLATVCTVFIVPDALSALGFDSLKVFFAELLSNIGKSKVLFFAAYLLSLVLNIVLKCFTVVFCKKALNSFVFLFDLLFIVCCVLLLLTNTAPLLLLVAAITLFAIIFDFVFFFAEM